MATGLENLKVYQMAEDAELEVYELTKKFPSDEKYRSVDQLRRSSASVANNVAEAYNKKSVKDKIRILNDIAKCEAEETKRKLIKSAKKGFCKKDTNLLAEKYTEIIKCIYGYIRFLKKP
jgi:four helix bundle protein